MSLLYKLDARQLGSLWANDAKTVQATDGSVVAVWSPLSGSTITTDLVQTSNTLRPLYRANYNSSGYPGVEFDGANDAMVCAYSSAWAVTSVTCLAVITCRNIVNQEYFLGRSSSSWTNGWQIANYIGSFHGGGSAYNAAGSIPNRTGMQLFVLRVSNGVYQDFKVSDRHTGLYTSGSIPSSTNDFRIGAVSTGLFSPQIGVHHVSIWDTALTHSELDAAAYECDQAFGLGLYASRATSKPTHPMYQQVIG